jgi:hypothetical protein
MINSFLSDFIIMLIRFFVPKCSFQDHKYVYIPFATLYNGIVNRHSPTQTAVKSPDPKNLLEKEQPLAKPNFDFQKRQKEIAKKKKSEEKRQRKMEKNTAAPAENPVQPPNEGEAR